MTSRLLLAMLATVGLTIPAGADTEMNGITFVATFRDIRGETITISDCRIGGATSAFVRCETANRSASYALEAATMDRQSYMWALHACPTGSILESHCQVRVRGEVDTRSGIPTLQKAAILDQRTP